MKKIAIAAGVALLAVAGGAKLYLWWGVSGVAEKLAGATPGANMRYGGTSTSLMSGEAAIEDIEIRPRGYGSTIRIKALRLATGGPLELLQIARKMRSGNPPKRLTVEIEQSTLDLSSRLAKDTIAAGNAPGIGLPLGTAGCGERTGFSVSDYRRMGKRELRLDARVGYELAPEAEQVRVFAVFDESDAARMSISATLAGRPPAAMSPAAVKQQVHVKSARLDYEDRGWHTMAGEFCTRESGQSRKAFAEAHGRLFADTAAALGIEPGPVLTKAYTELVGSDGRFSFRIDPAQPVKWDELQYYAPGDALYFINPTLTVNGSTVALDGIRASEENQRQSLREYSQTIKDSEPSEPTEFRTIERGHLARHAGESVRITVSTGRTFEGRLRSADDRVVRVLEETAADKRESIVPVFEITRAEVAIDNDGD